MAMALKKTLAQRLVNISKAWNQTCRLSTPSSAVRSRIPPPPVKLAPDPGDDAISRQLLQSRPICKSAEAAPLRVQTVARGEKLLEALRGLDFAKDRVRLDGLIPPSQSEVEGDLTMKDARKLLKVSQLQIIKSKLREDPRDSIFLEEFLEICSENSGSSAQGAEFAKMLDESGYVIVLGKFVLLRPEQEEKPLLRQIENVNEGSTFQTVALYS